MTSVASAPGVTAFVGKPSSVFYEYKTVLSQLGCSVFLVESVPAAKKLIDTQTIKAVVNNLDLDEETTRLIILEIRRTRPHIKIVEGGSPLSQVVEDNCYAIARNIDGTITVEQFHTAVKQAKSERFAERGHVILVLLCVVCLISLPMISASPYVKFVGTFWVVLLALEFGYCGVVWYRARANEY